MAQQAFPLIMFYKGWETYQRSLVETIAPLSSEQLALRAGSHQWTIGMVAQHMIANRVWWFQVWMGEGSPELAPIVHWDPADYEYQPPGDPVELLAGLKASWNMIADSLARRTVVDLEQVFQPPAALREEERELFSPSTRQWIIWHVLEHEIHHGGELSLALGGYGLQGIYGDM